MMEKKLNFIKGVDFDDENLTVEYRNIIEFEIEDAVSLLYFKNDKKFYVEYIDCDDDCNETIYELNDDFDGMYFGKVFVSKKDYDDFKELVSKVT